MYCELRYNDREAAVCTAWFIHPPPSHSSEGGAERKADGITSRASIFSCVPTPDTHASPPLPPVRTNTDMVTFAYCFPQSYNKNHAIKKTKKQRDAEPLAGESATHNKKHDQPNCCTQYLSPCTVQYRQEKMAKWHAGLHLGCSYILFGNS